MKHLDELPTADLYALLEWTEKRYKALTPHDDTKLHDYLESICTELYEELNSRLEFIFGEP